MLHCQEESTTRQRSVTQQRKNRKQLWIGLLPQFLEKIFEKVSGFVPGRFLNVPFAGGGIWQGAVAPRHASARFHACLTIRASLVAATVISNTTRSEAGVLGQRNAGKGDPKGTASNTEMTDRNLNFSRKFMQHVVAEQSFLIT